MNEKTKFYDGAKLLSMKDLNGNTPEIFICTSNRSAGKTTYFARLLVNRYLKSKKKFLLLYRYKYELDGVADKFFKDIQGIFFNGWVMNDKTMCKGLFKEIRICTVAESLEDEKNKNPGEVCGYAIALNSADSLKKYSHFFSDVDSIMFDEFQSESNEYCPNEIQKLISIHTSIARGQGKQARYLPIYMISNPVSLINPYYTELGITTRLRSDTKFLKGIGFVLEQGFNESASNAQKQSAFNQAFSNNAYTKYASESIYLNDNLAFIEKPSGKSRYMCTIKFKGQSYAIREYLESGILYCDDRADESFWLKIAVTTEDHNINWVMLRSNALFLDNLRWYFNRGCFRFKNIKCKEAILTALSY